MKIELTDEQMAQLKEDEFLDITGIDGFSVYMELDRDMRFVYGEFRVKRKDDGSKKNTKIIDADDLNRIKPWQVKTDTYSHDKCCPNCWMHLNYQYKYCPECGQCLSWGEG